MTAGVATGDEELHEQAVTALEGDASEPLLYLLRTQISRKIHPSTSRKLAAEGLKRIDSVGIEEDLNQILDSSLPVELISSNLVTTLRDLSEEEMREILTPPLPEDTFSSLLSAARDPEVGQKQFRNQLAVALWEHYFREIVRAYFET